jgi:hypothetical protein
MLRAGIEEDQVRARDRRRSPGSAQCYGDEGATPVDGLALVGLKEQHVLAARKTFRRGTSIPRAVPSIAGFG